MSNDTNTTSSVPPLATNSTSTTMGNSTHANMTSANTTTSPSNQVDDDDAMVTMLTFGPLSSCITLPDLSAKQLPSSANLSNSAVQAWLTSLPTSSSCSPYSWTFKPDYTEHLNAMGTLQQQLEQLFPTTNSTLAGQATVNDTWAAAGNGSFFGNTSALGLGSSASSKTLPTGLPLWMGLMIACAALVHLIALVLHICSDLDALLPSLAAKLDPQPEDSVLPSHAMPPNESSATLVDAETVQKADVDADAKVVDLPGYAEPAAAAALPVATAQRDYATMPTPALISISRKAKRFLVPLLLLSTLGSIGVAVVLNSKFAAGPVNTLPTSLGSSTTVPAPASSSSASIAVLNASTSSSRSDAAPTALASDIPSSTRQRTSSNATNTTSNIDPAPTQDRDISPSPSEDPGPAATATPSMTRLVKRQNNFFPAVSPTVSSSSASLASSSAPPVPTASATSSTSLFPPMPTSTSVSAPTSSLSAAPCSTTASNTSSSLLVLEKGDSMHRIWWIVMLDLILWFAQRRRTRKQTALDQARATILDHFAPSRLRKV
ncbi:hypothetical protein NDA13_005239 [Ustilago tritici]|nr:hypothetical protein NDA13_005239 [Ustilago tritici]